MADPSWRTAGSQEEFIHDIIEGSLKVLENDSDLSGVFEESEYEDLAGSYDRDGLYGNPLTNLKFYSLEDKPVPENTVECLKQTDNLYEGVAKATKSAVEKMATKTGKPISEFEPSSLFNHIVGILMTTADHFNIKPWANETDAIFFNDPTYITSVQ